MKIITDAEGLVIKSWCMNPEDGAIEQAKNLARLPFIFRQPCLMPDTHQGYGMPIGGVLATTEAVIPNAGGSDLGCGMSFVRTSLMDITPEELNLVDKMIRETIPVGFVHHIEMQNDKFMPPLKASCPVIIREYQNARRSLGTLGGGNHFIEIQLGDDGHLGIMLHSGSRNTGKQVADHYNKKAIALNKKYFSAVRPEWDLAFLPLDSEDGQLYLNEMQYCMDYAFANRSLMMDRIKEIVGCVCGATFEPMINIHHNYANMEHHYGKNVLVHRKGATSARLGEIGIIPGSQGTSSYIVRGLGNKESFMSCSHGAGRSMSATQAEKTLDLAAEQKRMDDLSLTHYLRSAIDLSECAGAYKDIDTVMAEQADLVEIVTKLIPIRTIKAAKQKRGKKGE